MKTIRMIRRRRKESGEQRRMENEKYKNNTPEEKRFKTVEAYSCV